MKSKFIELFADKTYGKPYPSSKYQIKEDDNPKNIMNQKKLKYQDLLKNSKLR